MPYINVDEAYVLDNTGLQVDNSVDYANANSNRNLLDNPFFTVNQRGVTAATSYTNAYSVDRWKSVNIMNVTVDTGYITLKNAYSSGVSELVQIIPIDIVGKTATMSVMLSDGTIYSKAFTMSTSSAWLELPNSWYLAAYGNGSDRTRFRIYSPNNTTSTLSVAAVKLELGSYSTLINDVAPDYAEELAKCQYYYREIKCTTTGYAMIGFATAATAFQACLPYTMRVRPTITYSGTLTAYYAGGNSAVTAVAANAEFTNSIQVAFTTTGLTAGSIVALAMGSGAKLMFSADL